MSSDFANDDDYTPILDANLPVESPLLKEASTSPQAISSPQNAKEDSTPKATFDGNPPQSREDSIPKANSPPKCGKDLTIGIVSTSSSHPQLIKKSTGLESFWTNKLLQKVKSSYPYEHESLREETTKLYKTLMMHGLDISGTRDKIYEVFDLAKIVHNMESEESDPTAVERKELMKNAESLKKPDHPSQRYLNM